MDVTSARSKKRQNKIKNSKARRRPDGGGNANGSTDEVSGYGSDDDDCSSMCSVASSVESSLTVDGDLEDGYDHHEDFESILLENIEGARQKGAKNRQTCLAEVKKALCRRYMCDVLLTRKETILDFVEKLLKKGQKEDRILSSKIACALCIQLGEEESSLVFTTLKPILISIINDDTVSPSARASAASALGLSCFIGAEETEDTEECLSALKAVFSKKVPPDPAHHVALANALLAWGLLLTVATESIAQEQIDGVVTVICKVLEKGDLNLRIAAGETVALVFEIANEMDFSLRSGPISSLTEMLRDLANESGRHKGKREKRQQKSSFRDIIKSVEDGYPPEETIRFGAEYIRMTSWTWLCRYNAFKESLGSGTNAHLESNMLLREIFELGIPVSRENKENKSVKCERQWLNAVTTKARKQNRNQRRDNKHSAVANGL